MTDSFSAVGALLTMITILFTVWQPEIQQNLKVDVKQKQGNKKVIKELKVFRNGKVRVLLYSVLGISLAITPDIFGMMVKLIDLLRTHGLHTLGFYSPIYPLYVLLWMFSIILLIHLWSVHSSITTIIKKLEG